MDRSFLDIPIRDLGLPVRLVQTLATLDQVRTVGDLLKLRAADLEGLPYFGGQSLARLQGAVRAVAGTQSLDDVDWLAVKVELQPTIRENARRIAPGEFPPSRPVWDYYSLMLGDMMRLPAYSGRVAPEIISSIYQDRRLLRLLEEALCEAAIISPEVRGYVYVLRLRYGAEDNAADRPLSQREIAGLLQLPVHQVREMLSRGQLQTRRTQKGRELEAHVEQRLCSEPGDEPVKSPSTDLSNTVLVKFFYEEASACFDEDRMPPSAVPRIGESCLVFIAEDGDSDPRTLGGGRVVDVHWEYYFGAEMQAHASVILSRERR